MFSKGQFIFALFFFIVFTSVIIYSYRKDAKNQKDYFKGTFKILLFILSIILSLFLIKLYTQK
ncbi:MAG: hypothetical protein CMC79_00180 [Flavobacteriaceae bacterium]|nr:hypothetical protein [Flavobacteriaceae bacterium]